jgi:hypothetical protein
MVCMRLVLTVDPVSEDFEVPSPLSDANDLEGCRQLRVAPGKTHRFSKLVECRVVKRLVESMMRGKKFSDVLRIAGCQNITRLITALLTVLCVYVTVIEASRGECCLDWLVIHVVGAACASVRV